MHGQFPRQSEYFRHAREPGSNFRAAVLAPSVEDEGDWPSVAWRGPRDPLPELRDELEASSRRFPDSGWVETNRAALELALGHPALAHTAATRATDLLPAYAGAWVYRALAERACQKPHSESLDRARLLRHWEDNCRLRQRFELTPR